MMFTTIFYHKLQIVFQKQNEVDNRNARKTVTNINATISIIDLKYLTQNRSLNLKLKKTKQWKIQILRKHSFI